MTHACLIPSHLPFPPLIIIIALSVTSKASFHMLHHLHVPDEERRSRRAQPGPWMFHRVDWWVRFTPAGISILGHILPPWYTVSISLSCALLTWGLLAGSASMMFHSILLLFPTAVTRMPSFGFTWDSRSQPAVTLIACFDLVSMELFFQKTPTMDEPVDTGIWPALTWHWCKTYSRAWSTIPPSYEHQYVLCLLYGTFIYNCYLYPHVI